MYEACVRACLRAARVESGQQAVCLLLQSMRIYEDMSKIREMARYDPTLLPDVDPATLVSSACIRVNCHHICLRATDTENEANIDGFGGDKLCTR